ncbi:MAG: hypothetical protein KGI67_14345, partial [Pseudomonadota bacterium]|nr:hypothetical protein [Pseudomonadota bacterium]
MYHKIFLAADPQQSDRLLANFGKATVACAALMLPAVLTLALVRPAASDHYWHAAVLACVALSLLASAPGRANPAAR